MASQILLFPEPTERTLRHPGNHAPERLSSCARKSEASGADVISWQAAVRIRRSDADVRHRDQAGRMVMSGRMADVCAALDQMVAMG
jgi:hypothetical protein